MSTISNYISSVDAETVWREAQEVYDATPFSSIMEHADVFVNKRNAASKVISAALDKARAEERAAIAERIRLYAVHLVKDQETALLSAVDMIEQGDPENG